MSENTQSLPQSERMALKRASRLATTPTLYKGLFERCTGQTPSKRASPKQRIKAFCPECVGFDRAAVTGCTAWACPLWEIRPYQVKAKKVT